ncbi:MAG: hypothetical protein ACHQ1D_01665 [Nitrososphaerales archaeon]|jgi:hypothetical protein
MSYEFKTIPIERVSKKTGKVSTTNYVQVNERIKYFRTSPDFKGFSLEVGIEKMELGTEKSDFCLMVALVKDPTGRVIAMGRALEFQATSLINSTNFIENCETSAVGRALGFLGIGVDTSIATYEEVKNAMEKQEAKSVDTTRLAPPAKPIVANKVADVDAAIKSLEGQFANQSPLDKAKAIVIPFGKFKGHTIGSIALKDLNDWYQWLMTTDFRTKMTPDTSKVCQAIEYCIGGK